MKSMYKEPLIMICGMLGAGCTEISEQLSMKFKVSSVNTEKLLRRLTTADKDYLFETFSKRMEWARVDLQEILRKYAVQLVEKGEIIVEGRTAFLTLDKPADLKVFLWATEKDRAEHIAPRRNITVKEAMEHIRNGDEDRRRLVKRLYDRDWQDPSLYDLVINTSDWSDQEAATLIEEAYLKKKKR